MNQAGPPQTRSFSCLGESTVTTSSTTAPAMADRSRRRLNHGGGSAWESQRLQRWSIDHVAVWTTVTYSCDHNHPWPVSRNNHNNNHNNNHHSPVKADTKPEILNVKPDPEPVPKGTFADLGNKESSLIISTNEEFRWFRQGTVVAECVRQGRQASSVFFF